MSKFIPSNIDHINSPGGITRALTGDHGWASLPHLGDGRNNNGRALRRDRAGRRLRRGGEGSQED